MVDRLKKLNPDIPIFSIHDDEFKKYGRVLDFDTSEIVKCGEGIEMPKEGVRYEMSIPQFEKLNCAPKLRDMIFGKCPAQIGLCWGKNSMLNAFEFHRSSEINIAVTPIVVMLGLQYEIEDKCYDTKNIKAFYLEKGDIIEMYATTLHYCACQVSDEGFSCVIGLPEGTNDEIALPDEDKLLFMTNKWLICHEECDELINKGAFGGMYGINYEIKYKE